MSDLRGHECAGCGALVDRGHVCGMPIDRFNRVVDALRLAGFADADIHWSENAGPPADADAFAREAIFVICNSGMKNTVAQRIYDRVMLAIADGQSASAAFGHPGKAKAIDRIWAERDRYFRSYMAASNKVRFCGSLPYIGEITQYHLAKNFGADVAKPDVHLQRLADHYGMTAQGLCETLAAQSGLKTRTVDLLLWRACAEGVIDSRRPGYEFSLAGEIADK